MHFDKNFMGEKSAMVVGIVWRITHPYNFSCISQRGITFPQLSATNLWGP